MHTQATTTTEAYWSFDPHALVKPGDPWFADLESILPREHYGVTRKLERQFAARSGGPEFVHVGLLGHAGVGKTTLARSAVGRIPGLMLVVINSLEAFDQSDYTFSDLMLVVVESVIRQLDDLGLDLAKAELDSVRRWFADEILIETHRDEIQGSLGVSAEAGIDVPLLAKFAAKLTAALKSSNEYRHEIRRRLERDPGDLVRRVNLLLDAVHVALAPLKARLCVAFDNLEKTSVELVDRALLQRAEEFRRLRVNTLLFFNPASEYSPINVAASRAFECVTVPVLPVRFPGDGPEVVRPEAAKAIEKLLHHRVALDSVFEDPAACVHALAAWSGGHMRDLLMIARRAAENVEPERITATDIDKAGRWLGGRRTSQLRPEDFARAVEIHRSNRILDTEQDRRMLKNSCVLPYDGTEWWDVHPGVRADKLFVEAREASDDARG